MVCNVLFRNTTRATHNNRSCSASPYPASSFARRTRPSTTTTLTQHARLDSICIVQHSCITPPAFARRAQLEQCSSQEVPHTAHHVRKTRTTRSMQFVRHTESNIRKTRARLESTSSQDTRLAAFARRVRLDPCTA